MTGSTPQPDELDLLDPPGARRRITRRRFFRVLGAAAAAAVGGGVYAVAGEPHRLNVVRLSMPLNNLPASLAGKTLAHVSDLHVGRTDADYLRSAVARINALNADLVAITGDFMSAIAGERIGAVTQLLGTLARPPLGVFACLGNHDYGRAWRQADVADELSRRLEGVGVRVLRNQSITIGGLQLAGVDDLWAQDASQPAGALSGGSRVSGEGQPGGPDSETLGHVADVWPRGSVYDPEAVLPGLDPEAPAVALVHNPDAADTPEWRGFRGWMLCGHTHGGQVDLPLIGPPLLPIANRRYARGHVDLGGGRQLYVNVGLGYIKRVRFLCRPEVTVFQLARA